jgi:putative transposase
MAPQEAQFCLEEALEAFKLNHTEEIGCGEWNTPVFVAKENERRRLRMVQDFRPVNARCVRQYYPAPIITELVGRLAGYKIFTVLDLKSAYHQVGLEAGSRAMTAFSVRDGLKHRRFQWKRLCLGLASAPALFQQLLEGIFSDLPQVLVYLDDIVVMSMDEEEHYRILEEVLQRLKTAHLVVNPEKCQWVQRCVQYLGHQVSYGKLSPLPAYVSMLRQAPPPTTMKEARSFAGAIQWIHKFVPDCSLQLKPIQACINSHPFSWTQEADEAFHKLVGQLEDLELGTLQEEGRLVLTTDASAVGYGSVLKQHLADGSVTVLGFHSHAWNKTQCNWPARELELYGVLASCRHFRHTLFGRQVEVETDHKSLSENISPHKRCNTNKIANWLAELLDFDLSVNYVKGSGNQFADWLSRSLAKGVGAVHLAPLLL